LNEGLASTAELFPNPDYPLLLKTAYERQLIIPMADLCQSFPVDAANFQLAYAEASSFTWYLLTQYGNDGIEALLAAYADGFGCQRAPEVALGMRLEDLESGWRQVTFNESPLLTAIQSLLPWMIIFFAFLLPLIGLYLADVFKRRRDTHHSAVDA